ncbi:muconolactone Delta-isomerase family protein [Nocardioides sp. AE5]|uniref:muconolactone Delta-isomerase n=1 Tax=Nocardioides sp. AE5 TaxID=2962573 RepID=UPI00288294E2|nr:muconolactone Delta-isomerase family protein [Nocardioides sp. AE5]MDT0203158.1 muconolactone Delta-isomerase family protein [Nocardioides sp. AE5]
MEFLVQIAVALPHDMPEERQRELRAAELAAGQHLLSRGTIQRIWRVPGTSGNLAIWRAVDADELHRAISSLPLFPWLTVSVQALASHPVEERHDD